MRTGKRQRGIALLHELARPRHALRDRDVVAVGDDQPARAERRRGNRRVVRKEVRLSRLRRENCAIEENGGVCILHCADELRNVGDRIFENNGLFAWGLEIVPRLISKLNNPARERRVGHRQNRLVGIPDRHEDRVVSQVNRATIADDHSSRLEAHPNFVADQREHAAIAHGHARIGSVAYRMVIGCVFIAERSAVNDKLRTVEVETRCREHVCARAKRKGGTGETGGRRSGNRQRPVADFATVAEETRVAARHGVRDGLAGTAEVEEAGYGVRVLG